MSSGHHHGDAAELDTAITTPDFIAQCAALVDACIVDDSFDVPWLANRSRDLTKVYRDRRVPRMLKCGIDTNRSLPWHEIPEAKAMDAGLPYDEGKPSAHVNVATPLERAEVERQKPDDPDIWTKYSDEMDGYVRAVDDESIERVPLDMDLRVFADDDRALLDKIIAAQQAEQRMSKQKRFFRSTASPDIANSSGRIIRYRFSTPEVARDQHTISAWKLDNFRQNPVFLWAHAGREPPIGKVIELDDNKGYLTGSVEYAEREVYPFADMVFQLVRGGYINAVSTSWDPIDWKFSTDRSRPGGIDFKLVDLLELSQVPVPALPTALATARANGIDTQPLYQWAEKVLDEGGMILIPRAELELLRREAKMPAAGSRAASEWKVGASRNLPLNEDMAWDGAEAEKSIFEKANFDGDKPDVSFAKKGFLVFDSSAPDKKGSYKLPFAKVIDGRLTALASGIKAAASRLPQTDIPGEVRDEARKVIDHYEGQMTKGKDEERKAKLQAFKRDLGHVAWLAFLLSDLDFINEMVEWEAAIEEDDSPIPAQLAAVKKELGAILVAMAGEEVNEMVAGEDEDDLVIPADGSPRAKRAALAYLRKLSAVAAGSLAAAIRQYLAGRADIIIVGDKEVPLVRAGKVLSKKNADTLKEAHGHITRGCDMVRGVLEEADGSDGGDAVAEDGEDEARGIRTRKAKALKLKLAIAS
jgi:hypothetical protein